MRVLILTLGTRGDLELFLLLACTLKHRGHDVSVVTSGFHASRVAAAGINVVPVGSSNPDALDALLARLANVRDLRARTLAYVNGFIRPELAAAGPTLESLAGTADYFVSNLKLSIARNGVVIPSAFVTYDPVASLGELDRYSEKLPRERILELVAFPRALFDTTGQWSDRFHFTGFWLGTNSSSALPPEVANFLAAGSAPIVLTTGSMRMFEASRLAAVFAESLARLGLRGIHINAPDQNSTPDLLHTRDVPYAALFPHAALVVHHGGVGTLAEVLRAGKPSIVMPQILAQRQMAECLSNTGLNAGIFDPAVVSADGLAAAIHDGVTNTRYSQEASHFQEIIAKEAGVHAAVTEIERHLGTIARS